MAGIQKYDHAGNAAPAALSASINASVTAFTVTAGGGASYPTGGVDGKFILVLDRGTATEEKVLCDSRSGDTFTLNAAGRGFDGTSAYNHEGGCTVEHVLGAVEVDDMNTMLAKVDSKGDIPIGDGTSWTMLPSGADDTTLIADSSTATGWKTGQIQNGSIANGTLSGLKQNGSIQGPGLSWNAGTGELSVLGDGSTFEIVDLGSGFFCRVKADGITENELADSAVTSDKILNGTITGTDIAAETITGFNIADATVTVDKIASEAWTSWTPTVGQGGTVAATITRAVYSKSGRTVQGECRFVVTGTGTTGNAVTVTIPTGITQAYTDLAMITGSGLVFDSSGTLQYQCIVTLRSDGRFSFYRTDITTISEVGVDPNFAIGNNDIFVFTFQYEAAA